MANIKISPNDRKFEFGKYNGHTVNEIIHKDPQYIEYMVGKVGWLFTRYEKQAIKNFRNLQKNKDIYMINVRTRNSIEEEMYRLLKKM